MAVKKKRKTIKKKRTPAQKRAIKKLIAFNKKKAAKKKSAKRVVKKKRKVKKKLYYIVAILTTGLEVAFYDNEGSFDTTRSKSNKIHQFADAKKVANKAAKSSNVKAVAIFDSTDTLKEIKHAFTLALKKK